MENEEARLEAVATELANLVVAMADGEKDLTVSLDASAYLAAAAMRHGKEVFIGETLHTEQRT